MIDGSHSLASFWGYLILPLLGSLFLPARGRVGARLGDVVLMGPLALAALLVLLSISQVPLKPGLVFTVAAFLALVAYLLRRRLAAPTSRGQREASAAAVSPSWKRLALWSGLVGLLALLSLQAPIFVSDPVHIYATPALLYALEQQVDPALLSRVVEQEHLDYPPLFTLNMTWQFLVAGGYDGWIIKPLGAWFFGGLLWELASLATVLGLRRGRLAVVAAFGFLPIFCKESVSGFADLAVTAYMAGALASMLALRQGGRNNFYWALRGGLYLGAAASTKNEGVAFALLLLALLLSSTLLQQRWRWSTLSLATSVAILIALPWALWVRQHDLENDLVEGVGTVAVSTALERAPTVFATLAAETVRPIRVGNQARVDPRRVLPYGVVFPLAGGALVWAAVQLLRRRLRFQVAWLLGPAQVALYVLVFLFTPRDLEWHLDTAASRVLMQATPALMATTVGVWNSIINK
jgi:hypothetical protein